MANSGQEAPKHGLDDVAKIAAAFVVACYIFGFVGVNEYLYRNGVSDFEFFRARFIYAGFLALVPVILSFGWLYPLLTWIINRNAQLDKIGRLSRACAVLLFIAYLAIIILFPVKFHGFTHQALVATRYFALSVVMGAVLVLLVQQTQRRFPLASRVPKFTAGSLLLLFCFYHYIQAFADHYYPFSKEQFGGGLPEKARLLIEEDAVVGLKETGLQISEGGLSQPISILSRSSESYVICFKPSDKVEGEPKRVLFQPLRIDAKIVKAVQVIRGERVEYCWDHEP
jgi:hypothetical protein